MTIPGPEWQPDCHLGVAGPADGVVLGGRPEGRQVWSLSSFKVSRQLLTNDSNQVSSVSLLMTSSTALANEGLFELLGALR